VDDGGKLCGTATDPDNLADAVHRLERSIAPRWIWAGAGSVYPELLAAGVRVSRCHDLALTEALLGGHEGRSPVTDGELGSVGSSAARAQTSLFDVADETPVARPPLLAVHADQLARIEAASAVSPGFPLLVAAESAAALAAAEMGHVGLPWRADVHDRVLTDLLGERPRHSGRPPILQELADAVAAALDAARHGGAPPLNVDSPLELLRAFRRQGVLLETTRAHELKTVDHPAIEPLLRYKELARLHVAHGWAWRDQWVTAGRFKPEYVPGGVVSGRWATKGGGALQIPKAMRAAVIADPGWALVVADAGQLEPRLLAALSGDPGMIAATLDTDLYAALAAQALGRTEARDETKIALLAAMYGAKANSPAMAALRRRFPQALELLETAARTGEDGGIVRSALGRTCPPPSPNWQQGAEAVALARSRARGRFTRNFVIQASAADWANVLVAGLRRRLTGLAGRPVVPGRPDIVLFQHDEVVVHTPLALVGDVISAITESGAEATRLVVGDRGVRIPLNGVAVPSYADKP
jgi:DNA polymerase-1